MPEISIIVPVYKVERYLKNCVESLMAQTFGDIEIILVDDGSPDQCGAICDFLAKVDGRIRVIHQQNQGLSCARNAGINIARGKYICFVDSDDFVTPNYCQVLIDLLRGTELDFSVCGVCRFQDGTIPNRTVTSENVEIISNEEYLKRQLENHTEFGVWNKLFRREIFERIRFAPGKLNEDVILSADILANLNHGVAYTCAQLYLYRQRDGSIVFNQAVGDGVLDLLFAKEYLLDVVLECAPNLEKSALLYVVNYPWTFVDSIYIGRSFRKNKAFLQNLQNLLRHYLQRCEELNIFPQILIKRMKLFSVSKVLYALNAYARLARVYLYRLLGKDAYADGHGI